MWGRIKRKSERNQKGGTTLISPTTEIQGEVMFEGTMHVEGKVRGNISAEEGLFTLSQSGCIEGDICVPCIKIIGTVKGNVYCSKHLELAENAVITGSVFYNIIEMVMGAEVNGSLEHHEVSLSEQHSLLDSPEKVEDTSETSPKDNARVC